MSYDLNTNLSSIVINLRSTDANVLVDPLKTTHCQFSLLNPLHVPVGVTPLISVMSAEIPCTFYTVNAGNNKLYVTDDATRTLTIPVGNYNFEELRATLQTLLTSNSVTYTASKSTITGKFSFTSTHPSGTFDFVESTAPNNCRKLLGFSQSVVAFSNNSLVSERVCDLTGDIHSFIVVSDLGTINTIDSSTMNITPGALCKIPITADAFGINYFRDGPRSILTEKNLKTFEISILNQDLRQVDLNDVDWELSLLIDFVKENKLEVQEQMVRLTQQLVDEKMQPTILERQKRMQEYLTKSQAEMELLNAGFRKHKEHILGQLGEL